MGRIARRMGVIVEKARLLSKRRAPNPAASRIAKIVPGGVLHFCGSMSFQGLARQARILAANRGEANRALAPRWVLALAENIADSHFSEDVRREMARETLLLLKNGAENSERVLQSHLLDLSHRLNMHKEELRNDPKKRKLYEKYFLTNLPADAEWEELQRHFPYPDYASISEAALKKMPRAKLMAMHAGAASDERRIGGELRPVRSDYLREFDDINSVLGAIGSIRRAYAALDSRAFPDAKPKVA